MTAKESKLPILAILGPTASGKSALAMELAELLGGEIVNCDSRQIYEGMNIGTAKPSAGEMQKVKHHLFNCITPDQEFSAGDYIKSAVPEIKKLWDKKKIPILTGGTGFYYSAISEGLSAIGNDEKLVSELNDTFREKGISELVKILNDVDPLAGQRIDINNPRRIIRAIEIVKISGRPLADAVPIPVLPMANFFPIVVSRPREELHKRILVRIAKMIESGLEKEVKDLIKLYGTDAPGLKSIGYSEWIPFFENKIGINKVAEEILFHTRQYAKRQLTWFRKRPGVPIEDLSIPNKTQEIVKKTVSLFNGFF